MTPAGDAALPLSLIVELASHLPTDDLTAIADAAHRGPTGLIALRARSPSPVLRDACNRLLPHATEPTGPQLTAALTAASAAFQAAAAHQSVEIVWTGPDAEHPLDRLTGPALTELVAEASAELLIVSYAAHDHPTLIAALAAALDRGVDVTVLLERHADNPTYRGAGDTFVDLPLRRWVWPADRRPPGAALHAKIAVVDRRVALLGSANLTGRALADNLECGVLIRGGPLPEAVAAHLWSLRYAGILTDAR